MPVPDGTIKPAVAVVGASRHRHKYGNKSVRAHQRAGYEVYPIHPTEKQIEGFRAYKSVLDVPAALDRVTMYVPPEMGMRVVEEIATKGTRELFFNPGSESPELLKKARSLGLTPILACSIVNVGQDPEEL